MAKNNQQPSAPRQEQLQKIVEARRQRNADDNNAVCEASISYLDSGHARVNFMTAGEIRTAYYEFTGSGWYCDRDWHD
ncbi:hypothetical protein AHBrac6_12295 [Aeromonas hydrophila]|uniref:hypothetical protein n=1 Tax=Aeromonas hydrophila TaxID=644 RepID=UPI001A8C7FAB|nr:hypothetical protein [Aeromonas hydrophila]QSR77321.1 hypothetical protein AHBrac6_12295 [Aeromonas hydrophila]